MRTILLVWLTAGCTGALGTAPPPVDAHEQASALTHELHNAAGLAEDGRHHEARVAWSNARDRYNETLQPTLRTRSSLHALEIEYLLGRIGHELDRQGGDPQPAIAELEQLLWDRVDEAPPPGT